MPVSSLVRSPSLAVMFLLCACAGKGDDGATDTASSTGSSTSDTPATDATGTTASTGGTTTSDTDAPTTGAPAARPNWYEDIAPLVAVHCQGCHVTGGIAPFSMETYEDTRDWAGVMAFDVQDGLMPPWHALETPECDPPFDFRHDARLSEATKALFQGWADNGAQEGDPALAAPIPEPPSLDLPNATTTALGTATVDVEKSGATLDFFNCLSIDPGNATDVFLTGMQLLPGNRKIVHHVLIYRDDNAQSAGWQNGVRMDCGGGSGVPGAALIGAWVPGALPIEAPTDVGIPLPAGSRLILNVHYHATGGGLEQDQGTGLALRWTEQSPEWVSLFSLLGAPGAGESLSGPFTIPAGEAEHVEEFVWTVSQDGQSFPDTIEARLWAVAAHMHKVAVDLRVWVEDRDTAQNTCLLETPRWDFDWQRLYAYDVPIGESVRLKAGDKIHVRCVYDNTLANPGVQEALAEAGLDAPIDVNVGEETLDEMCISAIGVAVKGF